MYKNIPTILSFVMLIFMHVFLSPYRQDLYILDIKERNENSILIGRILCILALLILLPRIVMILKKNNTNIPVLTVNGILLILLLLEFIRFC